MFHHSRLRPSILAAACALGLLAVLFAVRISPLYADSRSTDFETYATGTVNGQNGWNSTGAAGSGCALYDHAIADNTGAPYSYPTFGSRSLRISNAVTSGCFSDHTFSFSLTDEAGESTATNDGLSGGVRQQFFEAEWDFASTVPGAEQPGMNVTANPDRGDGARMSWINMADSAGGLEVLFFDYQRASASFVLTTIASGLSRSQPHTLRVTMTLNEGFDDIAQPDNDVVCVFVDGALVHQGTSWENYFRDVEGNPTHTVDSILFRTSATAAPATAGHGFLIDNFSLFSGPIPAGFDTGCIAPVSSATPSAGSAAQPPLCNLFGGGTNPIVRADATPYQFCRVLVENGTYVQPGAEVGDINLINAGIWQAVDIFGYAAGDVRVTVFDQPLTVCLQGRGEFYYRDANGQPRTTALLSSWESGDYTCATVQNAGTVVLVGHGL